MTDIESRVADIESRVAAIESRDADIRAAFERQLADTRAALSAFRALLTSPRARGLTDEQKNTALSLRRRGLSIVAIAVRIRASRWTVRGYLRQVVGRTGHLPPSRQRAARTK